MIYASPKESHSLYFGAGPIVSWSGSEIATDEIHNNGTVATSLNNRSTFAYGLGLVMGTEWFVRKDISLMAEYGLTATQNNRTGVAKRVNHPAYDVTSIMVTDSDAGGFRVTSTGARLGLSVYF